MQHKDLPSASDIRLAFKLEKVKASLIMISQTVYSGNQIWICDVEQEQVTYIQAGNDQ